MSKTEKAKDLYMRGFPGSYIRRRTGVLWGEVKRLVDDPSKEAIVRYQAAYISRKWTLGQIEEAKTWLDGHYAEAVKLASSHKLIVLGCCFGQWQRVFRRLEITK